MTSCLRRVLGNKNKREKGRQNLIKIRKSFKKESKGVFIKQQRFNGINIYSLDTSLSLLNDCIRASI